MLQRETKLRDLDGAPDETRQTAHSRHLESRSDGCRARDLVDLDRLGEPFHGNEAEWLDPHVPLGESQRRRGHEDRPRRGHLLHASGEMGRLADR